MVKKKNSLWFSVECTLTHNGMRHNSGQNLLWNHSAAARESTAYLIIPLNFIYLLIVISPFKVKFYKRLLLSFSNFAGEL